MSNDIAKSLITQMAGQVDLLTTLSVAVCGGVVALLMQTSLHNRDSTKETIGFRGSWLLMLAFVLEGVSLVAGYVARGAITSLTPTIFRIANPDIANWTRVQFEGVSVLRQSARFQIGLFLAGIVLIIIFVYINRKEIGR